MDIVLLGIIGGYIAGGWRTGFVRRAVGLAIFAGSFLIAAYLRSPIGSILTSSFKNISTSYADMVAYTIAFGILTAAGTIVAHVLLKKVAVTGMTHRTDQTLGAILGGVEAVLIISAAIVILDTYFGTKSTLPAGAGLGFLRSLRDSLDGSIVGQILAGTTVPIVLGILGPLLPGDIRSVIVGGRRRAAARTAGWVSDPEPVIGRYLLDRSKRACSSTVRSASGATSSRASGIGSPLSIDRP